MMRSCFRRIVSNHDFALIVSAIFCTIRGVSYLPVFVTTDQLPRGVELVTQIFGLYFWVLAWCAVGLYAFLSAVFYHHRRHIAWGLVSGLLLGWGCAYMYGVFDVALSSRVITRDLVRAAEYIFTGIVVALLSNRTLNLKPAGDGDSE